jgi:uncharacterized protein (UPF0335 family)
MTDNDTTDLVARLHTLSTALLPMEGEVGEAWNVPDEAADTIDRITRERDEARQWVEDVKNVQENANAEGYAEAKAHYEARIAKLEAALDSFARDQQSEAQAGTGEYQRGYDDCIADHADRARAALEAKP